MNSFQEFVAVCGAVLSILFAGCAVFIGHQELERMSIECEAKGGIHIRTSDGYRCVSLSNLDR